MFLPKHGRTGACSYIRRCADVISFFVGDFYCTPFVVAGGIRFIPCRFSSLIVPISLLPSSRRITPEWIKQHFHPQVSSAEATSAALRLEEMTAVLETQQRELELLRAYVRGIPNAKEQHHHQQKRNQAEVGRRENSAPRICPLIHTSFEECISAANEGNRSGNHEGDPWEEERIGQPFVDVMTAGCSEERTTGINSVADDDTDRALIASERREAAVPGTEKANGHVEQARAAVSKRGRSTGVLKANPSENGDPAPETNHDDAGKRHDKAAFSNAFLTTMATARLSHQRSKPPLEFRREGEGFGPNQDGEEAEVPNMEGPLPDIERGGNPLRAKATELGAKRFRQVGVSCRHKGRQDETSRDGGSGRTRSMARAEAELLVRVKRCEEENHEREKEAACLRAGRQDVLRRLRTQGRESVEKVRS